jgi:hypothetical protein
VFLPKYSPSLNPIEQIFARLKTLLRKVGARSYEAIFDACGEILAQYPPAECAHTSRTQDTRKPKNRRLFNEAFTGPTSRTSPRVAATLRFDQKSRLDPSTRPNVKPFNK